jgi:hypothetical protein
VINGLYKVNFQTDRGSGQGVLVLENGKAFGGDSTMYYSGDYEVRGAMIRAKLVSGTHSSSQGRSPVFGASHTTILLTGFVEESGPLAARFSGVSQEAPGVKLDADLQLLVPHR